MQRAYPAMAIEVQQALGIERLRLRHERGLLVGHVRHQDRGRRRALRAGARACWWSTRRSCSGHLNFRDRDSHFIFGDVCTAVVVESGRHGRGATGWEILGTRLETAVLEQHPQQLRLPEPRAPDGDRPAATSCSSRRAARCSGRWCRWSPRRSSSTPGDAAASSPTQMRRFWLHQANLNMNQLIGSKLLGRDAGAGRERR